MRNPALFFATSSIGGRGVFTTTDIKKDDTIEVCPVIVMQPGEVELLDKTTLYDYYFLWGDDRIQHSS